jgi:hypothetical protein
MVMPYVNIYRNLHNLNIMKVGKDIIVEAVGPGFLSRDLTIDGHLHEEIVFELPKFNVIERKIISENRYKKSKERKMTQFAKEDLEKNKSHLLTHNKYLSLNEEQIKFVQESYFKLQKAGKKLNYTNFVASCGYVEINGESRPVYWDIFEVK